MSNSKGQETPQVGDQVELDILYDTIPGTVRMILDEKMIVVKVFGSELALATWSKFGNGWMHEPMADRGWKYPAYVELRRAEVQKKVGDHVHVKVRTVVPSKDGDQQRWLPLCGTVKAIAEDGATLLDIEGFELYCDVDWWIEKYRPAYPVCDPGVYLPSGLRIN